jgi:hypothetical protein
LSRPGAMEIVRIGKVKDGVLERGHLVVHLVGFDVRFEFGEVVDGAFSMRGCDNIRGVLPDVAGDFAPGGFDCRNRIR